MFCVSVPWELTPVHLLELQDVSSLLRDQLQHSAELLARGDPGSALVALDRLAEAAAARRDRYVGALALVLRAEALRRMARWEDSLDAIRRALHWLERRVSPVARYNEGVAVYLEGVIHYGLRAEAKAVATFSYAQEVFADSERHWAFEHNDARAVDCRNVIRWMQRLLELQVDVSYGDIGLAMPVYEIANQTVMRVDAVLIQPMQIAIPNDVVAQYATSEIRPVQLDAVSVFSPHPHVQYAAIRIAQQGPGFGREGDLLIVELTASGLTSGELVLTSDTPFVRRVDGRVEFRSSSRRSVLGTHPVGSGLMGIPRALIRERGSA